MVHAELEHLVNEFVVRDRLALWGLGRTSLLEDRGRLNPVGDGLAVDVGQPHLEAKLLVGGSFDKLGAQRFHLSHRQPSQESYRRRVGQRPARHCL